MWQEILGGLGVEPGGQSDTASGYQLQIWIHWLRVTYGELPDLQ